MQRLNTANKTKKSNKELKGYKINTNGKPKTIIKPYSANMVGRSLKIGQNRIIKNRYSIDRAVRVIQKHFREYLSKLRKSNNELKEMIKQKKIGIIQSYNVVLDTETFKETAKFGVDNNNQLNSGDINHIEEKELEDNKANDDIDNCNNNNTLIESKHKDIAKVEGNHNRNQQIQINNDLIGLKRKFYYNDEESIDDNDNEKKIMNSHTGEITNHQTDKDPNTNKIITNNNNINNQKDNKKESIYERLYKEMKNRQMNSASKNNHHKENNNKSQPEIDVQDITLFQSKEEKQKQKQKEINKTTSLNQQSNSVCFENHNKTTNGLNSQCEIKKKEEDNKSIENLMDIPCLVKFQKKTKAKKTNENGLVISEVSKISNNPNHSNSNTNKSNKNTNSYLLQQKANDFTIISTYNYNDLNAKLIKSKKINEIMNKTIKDLKTQLQLLQIKEKGNETKQREQIKKQQEVISNLTIENKEKDNLINALKETINKIQMNSFETINTNEKNQVK